jgi:hypothetical protein
MKIGVNEVHSTEIFKQDIREIFILLFFSNLTFYFVTLQIFGRKGRGDQTSINLAATDT